ncbi:30S ribosomal protein S16 [Spongisporangium articulatum]|uniref:Small ribosomal subunit protein bS16 n=1 Tax=Spongisporangium articulatum TaxID=3362603 RepID=A0ABW8AN03_9ACTN
MSVKIRLKRMGKIRSPHYRIVVADSRTKRDGRAIEEIGLYHPTREPSLIEIESERVQYWLGVGAQPTEQVLALLKVKGEWQKFKGEPGAEGTYRAPGVKEEDRSGFAEAKALNENEAKTLKAKKSAEKAEKKAEPQADEAPAEEPKAAEAAPAADEAPAAEATESTEA